MEPDIEVASARDRADTLSSSNGSDDIVLEPIRTARTNISIATSRDDDPYENLEHAYTTDLETEAERQAREPIVHTRTGASTTSVASRPPDFEVVFEPNDPENPRNWSLLYRCWILFAVSYTGWVVVLYSTSYTSSMPGLMAEFGTSTTVTTLGMTTYLLGLALGSLVLAPASELYGRQPVYMVCLVAWALLVIPSALAKNLTTILVARFFCAFFGAVMIASSPGTVVDIAHPDYLAFTISMWSIAPMNAPSTGGIIGGFVFQYLGWRWSNWIILIGGGAAIAMMATVKETYAPTVLKRKAARMRKEMDDPRWWCQYDQRISTIGLVKLNMSRPFILFATEPILWFLNFWVSLVYGVLYLCFVAYPIVFSQHRGWTSGFGGLAFSGIGIGTMMAILGEPLIRRVINAQPRDPTTGKVLPESVALVMAIGGILCPIGQLGFSWTCLPDSIHWAIPIAFGIPFGMGNGLCFVYASNYLAGAYGIYSASALAGNAVIRSIFGGTLPLAGPKMYEALTPQWAGTLLGLMEVILIPIPFVLWRYGAKIRAKSKVIQQLQEDQERIDSKRAKWAAKVARRQAAAAALDKQAMGSAEELDSNQQVVAEENKESSTTNKPTL